MSRVYDVEPDVPKILDVVRLPCVARVEVVGNVVEHGLRRLGAIVRAVDRGDVVLCAASRVVHPVAVIVGFLVPEDDDVETLRVCNAVDAVADYLGQSSALSEAARNRNVRWFASIEAD